jgi:lycopene beta-cyclase
MDFRISQKGDCRFVYVLPSSPNEALVEYTIFSDTLLTENAYEKELSDYMKTLSPSGFELIQKESGVIPMYSEPFPVSQIPGLIQIGTSGGMTKASTGYTFMKVQKHSEAIVRRLLEGKMPDEKTMSISPRYFWFDRVLLRVLAERIMPGRDIFHALFRKNPPERVFRFLDEESNPIEELKIMNSVPAFKFMLPGIKELLRDLR